MKLHLLSAADLERLLPMSELIEVMKTTFAELSRGDSDVPRRIKVETPEPEGVTLFKPARTGRGLGAKLVSVFPGNRERGQPVTPGLMVLLDPATGVPVALLDGTCLTALRTGAASGAATDLLARPDVKVGALFGSGEQARTQALALDATRSLDEIRIYAPTAAHRERFAERMQPLVRARLVPVDRPELALEGAEVISTATTSRTPVFDGEQLAPGAHVNGVGSFTPRMREVDEITVGRANVFVDSRTATCHEAGELIAAWRTGLTGPDAWTELGEVVTGVRPGRVDRDELTFFKSVGIASQDVDAAAYALERAREQGLGQSLEL